MKKIFDDEQSRELIINDLDKNFFVEASAGSGKTTSLVYRMVALIEHGTPVDQICTITFTKAAADEFFNRFQALLSKRSVPGDDDTIDKLGQKTPETMNMCQEALSNIDSCFLGTIDAFCNMIAHELPSELGIPSDSEVIDMAEYISLVEKKYLEILKDGSHPLHDKALTFKDLIRDNQDALAFGVNAFLEMRHTEIIYDTSLVGADMDEYFKQDKKRLSEIVPKLIGLRDCYKPQKGFKNERYKQQTSLRTNWRSLEKKSWNDCLKDLQFALIAILKMDNFNTNVLEQGIDEWFVIPDSINKSSSIRYTEDFKKEINNIQTKLDEYKYAVFCDFVEKISALMGEEFKKTGKFQFFDFLYYLNNAFKKSAETNRELIDHILSRHSKFLLDESQDTNPLQTELFFHLTGTVNNKDWKLVKPDEGSLFIVGDPKQSIYSFRDANVSAYLDNKSIFDKENEVLVLTKNYRSNVRLREWFNNTMNDLLDHGPEPLKHIDIPISDKEKAEENVPAGVIDGVYKYCVEGKDDGEYIANLIMSWVGKEKIYSKNKDRTEENKNTEPKKKERFVKYSDFMIVPRSTDAAKIIAALLKYHIPMTIAAKIPYTSSQTLMVLKDLVYLLKEPSNVDNFLSVVHGPLYLLNEKDIISYKNAGFDLDISHSIEIDNPKLQEVIDELNYLYEETKEMSFSSTMLFLLNDKRLNVCKRVSASLLEYTYFLIQKIKEGEEGKTISTVSELRTYIENFILGKDDQRALKFKDNLDRVVISNVHKVKGLQAPIVILAKPVAGVKDPTKYVDFSGIKPKTYFSRFATKDGFNDIAYAETKRFESQLPMWKECAYAEVERLEYVAATRAESVLIVGSTSKVDADEMNPWRDLYNKVDNNFNNGDFVVNIEEPQPVTPVDVTLGEYNVNETCYKESKKFITPSQSRSNSRNTNKDEIDDSAYEPQEDKSDSTVKGTIIHRLMECIISSKNTYNIEDLIRTILSDYGYSKEYEEMLHNVASKILNGGFEQVNSSLDKDVLKTLLSAKKVWCEVPFSYQSDKGNVVSGIIDCMYLDDSGYHIIDYKTNEERDVSVLEKHYEGQLKHYKFALKKMGVKADAHIYHIDL